MKKLCLFLALASLATLMVLSQTTPSFKSFNTNHFNTNGSPWRIELQDPFTISNLTLVSNSIFGDIIIVTNGASFLSNVNVGVNAYISNYVYGGSNFFISNNIYAGTNISTVMIGDGSGLTNLPPTTWLDNLDYESWYDPMVPVSATAFGNLQWEASSGGAGSSSIDPSNAPAHFGTIAITLAGDAATTSRTLYLSDTPNTKPTTPRLDQSVNWTNTIVWRLNGTNNVKMYLGFQNGNYVHNSPLENSICIAFRTNLNTIEGHCSASSSVTTTNLGVMQSGVWYTNQIWSLNAGTILFNLNGGPPAALSANLPTTGLTPRMGIVNTVSGQQNSLEIDVWMFVVKR